MKKIFTFLSAMLIMFGLKAQKTTVHKETIKPVADSLVKKNIAVTKSPATQTFKKTQKDVKLAPAIKDAPSIKKTAPALKEFKKTTIEQ